jgi:predicted  nucleic acid-binding Zn-ribbon protein
MDQLSDFKDSTNDAMKKKEGLENKVETLDEHIHKVIEERDNYILEKLNNLQGDASDKVKAALDTQAQKKLDVLNESQKEIDETEEMLSDKLKLLDTQINERKDALSKIEQLGADAQIDVSGSLADVNAEIEEMDEHREKIIEKLRTKAKTSGKAIVI